MRYYHKFWEFSNKSGKICFPLGEIEFWTHYEFCAPSRIFGLRKSPEYLYRLFDVLPKQTKCEMKSPWSTSLHSAIISWEEGAKFM